MVSKCSTPECRSWRSVLREYFCFRPPAPWSAPDSPGCSNNNNNQVLHWQFWSVQDFIMSGNFEPAGRSIADLQQQQVEIDPMKTCLLATWTKFFERRGPWGKTPKFTRKKNFSPWIAYEWSGVLSDGSLVSERNPACSSDVVADGERIRQPQFSSQCAWNGNLSRSQTQNAVQTNSPVQKVTCLSLPTSASPTKAPNNQQDLISKLHASFLLEERKNHDLQQVNEEEE